MAVFKISFMTLAIFILATGILFSGNNFVSCQKCKGDWANLALKCLPYVQKPGPKVPPSKGCCDAINMADIPCLCKNLPPGIGDTVSVDKVAFVLKTCGKPLKPGTKCGNYTVPPVV